MSTLPEKPSELIRLALHDLELCEQDNRYIIDMDTWHTPYEGYNNDLLRNKCLVCLAGSVIAKSLNADACIDLVPCDYNHKTEMKLFALEYFRRGDIYDGIELLLPGSFEHMEFDNLSGYRDVIPYEENPTKFKQQMHELADDLELIGL